MRYLKLGAALVALSLLVAGCGRGDDGLLVRAEFADVGDLVVGGRVQMNDVSIGSIEGIELERSGNELVAMVTMQLEPGTRLPRDGSEAFVRQASLLGEQFVELLVPPHTPGERVVNGTLLIPLASTDKRVDVETFLGDLSGFIGEGGLEDLNRFTHSQALILEQRGEDFGETLDELEKFTGVLAGRREDVAAAIDNLASVSSTLATNQQTIDQFLDSLEDANELLADQGDELGALFRSLSELGEVNVRFLTKHEQAIRRQFKALRPILRTLAGAQGDLRVDITQLRTFFELFPRSVGGGPEGSGGEGDYVQVEAVLCEVLDQCNTNGEKGDVPGEGS